MSVDTVSPSATAANGLGVSSDETIAHLRNTVAVKEAELDSLQMRIKTTKSGRASVRLAASRFLQKAEEQANEKRTSIEPIVKSGNMSSLMSRWNAGIERQVEKTKVDLNGGRADVRGASKRFSAVDASLPRPKGAETKSTRKPRGPVGPAEFEIEDDESVPAWAVNQRKTVVKKENARASISDVDVRQIKGGLMSRPGDVDTSNVRETPMAASNGGVAAALAKWGKIADEEAKKLERVNVVEQARREEAKKQKELEEELQRMREEQEKKEREEREKREAEDRALRAKKEAEERARRLEEEKKLAKKRKEEEIRTLRALSSEEPVGAPTNQLIDWLEKRIKLLDLLITEAQAELEELEKQV